MAIECGGWRKIWFKRAQPKRSKTCMNVLSLPQSRHHNKCTTLSPYKQLRMLGTATVEIGRGPQAKEEGTTIVCHNIKGPTTYAIRLHHMIVPYNWIGVFQSLLDLTTIYICPTNYIIVIFNMQMIKIHWIMKDLGILCWLCHVFDPHNLVPLARWKGGCVGIGQHTRDEVKCSSWTYCPLCRRCNWPWSHNTIWMLHMIYERKWCWPTTLDDEWRSRVLLRILLNPIYCWEY